MASLRDELAHVARLGTLGELASGLAHELSQPLASLNLYASGALMCASPAMTQELRKCLEAISVQSLRAGEIVRRMRSFVRPGVTQRANADANRLIREVLSLLDNLIRHNHVKTALELADDPLLVFVDAIQIQQVLVNLIRNAVEALALVPADARRILIRSERSGTGIRISIIDTGHGIDPKVATRLFDPFQTTKSSGLGLGLTISRTLVEAHNGRIGAQPNPEGGTVFWMVLPAAEPENAA
jgi:two-component system sensor kinase FixL